MTVDRDQDYWAGLVRELCKLPAETPWLEFKHNNDDPDTIGEYLSALSNAAALDGKANAYLIWGIENGSHAVLGTSFVPARARKGGEELESWLLRMLSPRLHFRFVTLTMDGQPLVLLEIPTASGKPTQFAGKEWVRVGSNKKSLKDYPELERELWRRFDRTPFEAQLAAEHLPGSDVLALLDYPAYFDLLKLPLPEDRAALLARLEEDRLLVHNEAGTWDITNLGAILFAKDLHRFRGLARKAMRVVVYEGKGRIHTRREQEGRKGYASGFSGLMDYINALLPRNEVIGQALRREVPMYPDLAVRELVDGERVTPDQPVGGVGRDDDEPEQAPGEALEQSLHASPSIRGSGSRGSRGSPRPRASRSARPAPHCAVRSGRPSSLRAGRSARPRLRGCAGRGSRARDAGWCAPGRRSST